MENAEKYMTILLIGVICLLLYSNVYDHLYVVDDYPTIISNNFVKKGVNGLSDIFTTTLWAGSRTEIAIQAYRPLVIASFAIEYQLFGFNPSISHIINVLLYALLCIFIYLTFLSLFKGKYPYLPLLITLVFATHPIHTEVVCNLKSRDELLSLLFAVMSLYFLIKYIDTTSRWRYYFAIFCYFCSLLSKETNVCFLGIIPLTLYYFHDISWKRVGYHLFGFIVVFGIFLLIRAWVLATETLPFATITHLQNPLILAKGFNEVNGTKLYILGKYLQLMVLPYNLTFSYFYNDVPITKLFSIWALLTLLIHAGMLYYIYQNFRHKDLFSYGLVCYLGGIFLFSHIVLPFGNAMGERLAFTASLGYCIFISYLFYKFLKISLGMGIEKFIDMNFSNNRNKIVLGLLGLTLVLYSFKSYHRNKAWHDYATLCETDIAVSPNSYLANLHLASTYYTLLLKNLSNEDILKKCLLHFEKINMLEPHNIMMWEKHGLVHLLNKDAKKAEYCFREALLRYESTSKQARTPLALSVSVDKMEIEWENIYTQMAVVVYPSRGYLYRQIGISYFLAKQYDNAILYFQEALKNMQTERGRALVWRDLGASNLNLQKYEEALKSFSQAYNIEPQNAKCSAGIAFAYYQLKNYQEAGKFFENAFKITPNLEIATNLISTYMQIGDKEKAAYYQKLSQSLQENRKQN
jgi:tetratricopeptide (TPR) repeat protein